MGRVEWKNRCTGESQNLQTQMFRNRDLSRDVNAKSMIDTLDIRGGRNLDRRIIPAIFLSQRRSGNGRRDHEGWSRIHHWYWVSKATKTVLSLIKSGLAHPSGTHAIPLQKDGIITSGAKGRNTYDIRFRKLYGADGFSLFFDGYIGTTH